MRDGAEHNRKIDARHFLPAAERCPFLITNRDEEASGDGKMYYLHCDITFFFLWRWTQAPGTQEKIYKGPKPRTQVTCEG